MTSHTAQPNPSNSYTGVTTVTGYLWLASTPANGGSNPYFGKASSASANLIPDNGGLMFRVDANNTNDRGFTLVGANNALSVKSGYTQTLSGTITGSGDLKVSAAGGQGGGMIVRSGNNDFTGTLSFETSGGAWSMEQGARSKEHGAGNEEHGVGIPRS